MAKIYSEQKPKNIKFKPKKETVDFLLNYSKALRVNCFNEMKFELFLN